MYPRCCAAADLRPLAGPYNHPTSAEHRQIVLPCGGCDGEPCPPPPRCTAVATPLAADPVGAAAMRRVCSGLLRGEVASPCGCFLVLTAATAAVGAQTLGPWRMDHGRGAGRGRTRGCTLATEAGSVPGNATAVVLSAGILAGASRTLTDLSRAARAHSGRTPSVGVAEVGGGGRRLRTM